MAILTDPDRLAVQQEFCADLSAARTAFSLSKADLRAAVNALDDYMNTNAAAINSAIPLPARTTLTVAQKAMLLNYVVRKRYIVGA